MTEKAYETILVERDERVGTITLNRPQALNALTSQVMHEVTSAAAEFDADSRIGAIIITNSGISRPVMPIKTNSVCRWLVIRSNSRIACVNHITTVKLTSVITNAPMVARNM